MKFPRTIFIQILLLSVLCLVPGAFAETKKPAPPTEAECEKLAHEMEDSFNAQNISALMSAVDVDALLDRSLAGVVISEDVHDRVHGNFSKGFLSAMKRSYANVESYHLLRIKKVAGEPRMLFRVRIKSGGVNYQELVAERSPEGRLRVVDMYVYLTGELMSETVKRTLAPALAEGQKSILEKFFADQPDIVKYQSQWVEMAQCSQRKDHVRVLEINNQLPLALQQQKFILSMRLIAAQAAGEQEYLKAIDLWRTTYPNDASIDLISLDAFFLRKKYSDALAAVDRLDKALEGDPYLNIQRAAACKLMGDYDGAVKAIQQGLHQEPSLFSTPGFALSLLISKQEYADAVLMLNEITKRPETSKSALMDEIEYDSRNVAFVKSAEYRKWAGAAAPAPEVAPHSEPVSAAPAPVPPAPASTLKLQGIFYKTTSASATINGKYVMVGDSVTGYKVLAIERQSVTLQGPDGEKTTLMLK